MLDVLKTVNKILRIVFIGVVAVSALIKVFDIKQKEVAVISDDDTEYITSEFDEIW